MKFLKKHTKFQKNHEIPKKSETKKKHPLNSKRNTPNYTLTRDISKTQVKFQKNTEFNSRHEKNRDFSLVNLHKKYEII